MGRGGGGRLLGGEEEEHTQNRIIIHRDIERAAPPPRRPYGSLLIALPCEMDTHGLRQHEPIKPGASHI